MTVIQIRQTCPAVVRGYYQGNFDIMAFLRCRYHRMGGHQILVASQRNHRTLRHCIFPLAGCIRLCSSIGIQSKGHLREYSVPLDVSDTMESWFEDMRSKRRDRSGAPAPAEPSSENRSSGDRSGRSKFIEFIFLQ